MASIHIKTIEFLKQQLPICVDILSTYDSGTYCSVIVDGQNIAILNCYREWLVYGSNTDWLCSTVQSLSQKDSYRFLIYAPTADVLELLKHYHQSIEHFMIRKATPQNMLFEGRSAYIEDLDNLVDMQSKYVYEEIDWPDYRHVDLRTVYMQRIQEGLVFVDPQGFSKIEITAKYGDFVKLGRVYTVPQRRGMGHAKKLLNYVNNWCENQGYIPCLNVSYNNAIAIHLYKNCSYVNMGRVAYLKRMSGIEYEKSN